MRTDPQIDIIEKATARLRHQRQKIVAMGPDCTASQRAQAQTVLDDMESRLTRLIAIRERAMG